MATTSSGSVRAAVRRRSVPLPAIAITAYAEPEDRIQALSAGYQLHLAKPTEPALLAESILGLLRATRASGPKAAQS